jgi:hypothetical protein
MAEPCCRSFDSGSMIMTRSKPLVYNSSRTVTVHVLLRYRHPFFIMTMINDSAYDMPKSEYITSKVQGNPNPINKYLFLLLLGDLLIRMMIRFGFATISAAERLFPTCATIFHGPELTLKTLSTMYTWHSKHYCHDMFNQVIMLSDQTFIRPWHQNKVGVLSVIPEIRMECKALGPHVPSVVIVD